MTDACNEFFEIRERVPRINWVGTEKVEVDGIAIHARLGSATRIVDFGQAALGGQCDVAVRESEVTQAITGKTILCPAAVLLARSSQFNTSNLIARQVIEGVATQFMPCVH